MEVYDTRHGYIGKKLAEYIQYYPGDDEGMLYYVLSNDPDGVNIKGFPVENHVLTRLSDQAVIDLFHERLQGLRDFCKELLSASEPVYKVSLDKLFCRKVAEFKYLGEDVGVFSDHLRDDVDPRVVPYQAHWLKTWPMREAKIADAESIKSAIDWQIKALIKEFTYFGVDVSKER